MLSVIIPARNEVYLEKTVRNILENAEGDIEVIVMLDGYVPDPQIVINDSRVKFVHLQESIGQRQCVNKGAEIASGKYIMKLDAHCAVDKGFDVKLAKDCEYDWTIVPRMYNLDVKTWQPKWHKMTDYMYIGCAEGRLLRAEYFGSRQPKSDLWIDDTMCCMGPGWFLHKDRFWELGGMDEKHGGWGQMGVEVACKAWLSGGALKVNKKTWFAHWFRGGDGGFPYHITGRQVEDARKYSRDLWLNNKWEKQTRQFQWLVDKFNPPGWEEKVTDLTILYYTANVISKKIAEPVIRSLKRHNIPIISVSQEPMDLGRNIVVEKKRSLQNIYRQVLVAARAATTEYVALCEDDCLYVNEHFRYRPSANVSFAYNLNRWLLHLDDCIYTYRRRPILSQCIARREDLIKNLEERFKLSEIPDKYCGEMGVFDKQLGMTEYKYETFFTETPNLVICHDKNTMGRKYWGKDAEPRKELEIWGPVAYWCKKMLPQEKWGRGAKPEPHKQHCHVGSVILEVEEMCKNRMDYGDPRKLDFLKTFLEVFPPFLDDAISKELTDDELKHYPYFDYLMSKYKTDFNHDWKVNRCLYLMRDAVKLYYDIKENGLRNPLDMWREGDRLVLHRGGRRLEIIRKLGYRKVPCRVFNSKELFIKYNPSVDIPKDDNSIHVLGMKQFQKLKERATDKYWVHSYTLLYDKHLGYLRPTAKKILELGVLRGASLLLWKEAFPKAHVYGVDHKERPDTLLDPKDKRITFLLGSQQDTAFLKDKVLVCNPFDVIIDDCGHRPKETRESFKLLWDSLVPGGWYVIEDLYGNYRKDRVQDSFIPDLKNMVDEMNLKGTIKSLHFYYNICFIQKA